MTKYSFVGKLLKRVAISMGVVLIFIQFVPYGRSHSNPPASGEPAWDSAQTRVLAKRACFDCHSNETQWPWYSHVAPVSWLMENDVTGGRNKLNFSEWNLPQKEAGESAQQLSSGKMPQWFYVAVHPHARLTPDERQTLIAGLSATGAPQEEKRSRHSEKDEH